MSAAVLGYQHRPVGGLDERHDSSEGVIIGVRVISQNPGGQGNHSAVTDKRVWCGGRRIVVRFGGDKPNNDSKKKDSRKQIQNKRARRVWVMLPLNTSCRSLIRTKKEASTKIVRRNAMRNTKMVLKGCQDFRNAPGFFSRQQFATLTAS